MQLWLFLLSWAAVLPWMAASNHSLDVGMLTPWTQGWELGPYMGSAIVVGLEEVEKRQLLPGYTLDWKWADTYCEPRQGLASAIDLWSDFDTEVDAYIGGGCSVVCEPVALLSAAWNIPYVSFGCTSDTLSNKYDYPTFTRSVGTWISLAPMFDKLADAYKWQRVGLVTSTENIMQLTANAIKSEMERSGKTVLYHTVESVMEGTAVDQENLKKMKEIQREVKQKARILILLMYDDDVVQFMLSALDEGMVNGHFAFIVLDSDISAPRRSDRVDDCLYAYEGLVSANLRTPRGDQWDRFADEVRAAFSDRRFDGYNKLAANEEVDVHAGMLHDAVLAWAYGVNATLAQGGQPNDGVAVANKIFNSSFQGITGKVIIDSNGDRKPDYSVTIINNNQYVTLFDYLAFDQSLVPVETTNDIFWSAGSPNPPSDTPRCGWNNELCTDSSSVIMWVALASTMTVLIFVAVGVLYFYRKMKFEAQLSDINLWKIAWDDLQQLSEGACSKMSLARSSTGSFTSEKREGGRQLYGDVYTYKGRAVAVKMLNKPSVNIQDRVILLELKEMREMVHENINPFVGACVDNDCICAVMLYAPKGSLQDILQNEEFDLSKDFKIGIASDIAKGMEYLHQSHLGSHGHLTSSNCVVDNRWTCKVTDYGLGHFKSGQEKDVAEFKYWTDLLWTAPELLRVNVERPMYGTQKGDVYSYAIILQEIMLKDAAWVHQTEYTEPKDIVSKVREGSQPPYRPFIPEDACDRQWLDLMHRCWAEDAALRPTFHGIKNSLKVINGGKNINVMEQMVKLLEQHAEQLEDKVAERTAELDEEKGKVERLLYNILPKSVADQLKQGLPVVPESYDAVTIYFSDIVSFTTLAAGSTPIEVVSLLNELYSLFDKVSDHYDVYKVETIGDAYMVVSGLPTRNGNRHASEIAAMSLHLLKAISLFKIPHLPEQRLKLRIGLHTGPCVAGVVGTKMPRYCLFGDTVNTASRMESNSEAFRIHISQSTAELLKDTGNFELECRGTIQVKGKGDMQTYWLNGSVIPVPGEDSGKEAIELVDLEQPVASSLL